MARRPLTFKESDLKRAIKTAKAMGVGKVEVTREGSIIIHMDAPANDNSGPDTDWDEAVERFHARQ